jgi:peptidoglycan/xylan/chitin deacetylase (PgdA/CDA1 family)
MIFTSSWDDGNLLDIRLAELLKRYNLPGIFYIPTNCEMLPIDILKIRKMGFEIGAHTTSHPQNLHHLPDQEQYDEIRENKLWLEDFLKEKITKFCYPRGRFNDITIAMLKKLEFTEARTTLILETDKPEDPFTIRTSIHVLNNRPEYKGRKWFDVAKETFNIAKAKDSYFHIWGHSAEIDLYDEWNNLENFFKYVRQNI